jgi:ornithine cyclodeaminase/alanine dehydrogenase-like protein (mu-crystallin family)
MSLLVLSASDVERIMPTFQIDELLQLMATAFTQLSAKDATINPERFSIQSKNHNTFFMPSRIKNVGTAVKVVTVPAASINSSGLPASTLVIDGITGGAKALVNARNLTPIRTAAGT